MAKALDTLTMLRQVFIAWAGFALCLPASTAAQGVLDGTFSVRSPNFPSSLSGTITVQTPTTNDVDIYFPVYYSATVNSNSPVFSVGRVEGGSTAWAFDLNQPIVSGNSLIYSGTVDMLAFQIGDMLAGRTMFELNAYENNGAYIGSIDAPLVPVPEPSCGIFLLAGLFLYFVTHNQITFRPAGR